MKMRNGFVSNSSTSSFICDICGEEYEGWDACPQEDVYGCSECENGHIMCNEHLKNTKKEPILVEGCKHAFDRKIARFCPECGEPAWVEDTNEDYISAKNCPICQFKTYSESEMAQYLEKTRKISRDEVFTKIKAINKRRRKLYDSEYITHVCEKFSLTDDALLKEVKEKFEDFAAYCKFINSKK